LATPKESAMVLANGVVWPLSTARLADLASKAAGQQQEQQGQQQIAAWSHSQHALTASASS
jgi:hypothetical protein